MDHVGRPPATAARPGLGSGLQIDGSNGNLTSLRHNGTELAASGQAAGPGRRSGVGGAGFLGPAFVFDAIALGPA
jgi:hypothetical protein